MQNYLRGLLYRFAGHHKTPVVPRLFALYREINFSIQSTFAPFCRAFARVLRAFGEGFAVTHFSPFFSRSPVALTPPLVYVARHLR